MSEYNKCLRENTVKFGNDFENESEVISLFGPEAKKSHFLNYFKVPGKDDVIVCFPSDRVADGWHNEPTFGAALDPRGWNEMVSLDEYNADKDKSKERVEKELAAPSTHLIFWQMSYQGQRWIKFYGNFFIDKEATQADYDKGHYVVHYKKVSDEVPFT